MLQEHIYVGIRRGDAQWEVRPLEEITAIDLDGVNVARDVRTTLVLGCDLDGARTEIVLQARRGLDPPPCQ